MVYFFEINTYQTLKCNNDIYKAKEDAYKICKKTKEDVGNETMPQIIYSDRPAVTFKKMFLEPSIWLGYQTIS